MLINLSIVLVHQIWSCIANFLWQCCKDRRYFLQSKTDLFFPVLSGCKRFFKSQESKKIRIIINTHYSTVNIVLIATRNLYKSHIQKILSPTNLFSLFDICWLAAISALNKNKSQQLRVQVAHFHLKTQELGKREVGKN